MTDFTWFIILILNIICFVIPVTLMFRIFREERAIYDKHDIKLENVLREVKEQKIRWDVLLTDLQKRK